MPANRRREVGHSFLELITALAVTSITAAAVGSGTSVLRNTVSLISGRQHLATALEHARREAYRIGETATARPSADGRSIEVWTDETSARTFALTPNRIVRSPRRGYVRFFRSGLADNATFTIENSSGTQADIVINQRGEIRWR